MKIAVPTTDKRKLTNKVADTISHAEHFTIINIQNEKIQTTVTLNPARNQKRGAGPIVANFLSKQMVNLVLTSEIGPGLKDILNDLGIEYIIVESGETVIDVLEKKGFSGRERVSSPR